MGSLMAGWGSHASDPNLVKFRRNKSLTNDDIEAYWKSKKQREDQHNTTSLLSPRTHQKIVFERSENASIGKEEMMESETSVDHHKIKRKEGWWVNSMWAFLNEPPVIAGEGTAERYATHFHVTGSSTSNGGDGIGA